jgi:hypothetical protein
VCPDSSRRHRPHRGAPRLCWSVAPAQLSDGERPSPASTAPIGPVGRQWLVFWALCLASSSRVGATRRAGCAVLRRIPKLSADSTMPLDTRPWPGLGSRCSTRLRLGHDRWPWWMRRISRGGAWASGPAPPATCTSFPDLPTAERQHRRLGHRARRPSRGSGRADRRPAVRAGPPVPAVLDRTEFLAHPRTGDLTDLDIAYSARTSLAGSYHPEKGLRPGRMSTREDEQVVRSSLAGITACELHHSRHPARPAVQSRCHRAASAVWTPLQDLAG